MDANILQSFTILLLAVLVLAGFLFLVKKTAMKRNESKVGVNLNVISKISLQPKHHIFVVKVAEKVLVLGVSENNINILTELDGDFVRNIDTKSQESIKREVFSQINSDENIDLSFTNFLKTSLKLGN